jgi:hypothetical protein
MDILVMTLWAGILIGRIIEISPIANLLDQWRTSLFEAFARTVEMLNGGDDRLKRFIISR